MTILELVKILKNCDDKMSGFIASCIEKLIPLSDILIVMNIIYGSTEDCMVSITSGHFCSYYCYANGQKIDNHDAFYLGSHDGVVGEYMGEDGRVVEFKTSEMIRMYDGDNGYYEWLNQLASSSTPTPTPTPNPTPNPIPTSISIPENHLKIIDSLNKCNDVMATNIATSMKKGVSLSNILSILLVVDGYDGNCFASTTGGLFDAYTKYSETKSSETKSSKTKSFDRYDALYLVSRGGLIGQYIDDSGKEVRFSASEMFRLYDGTDGFDQWLYQLSRFDN